MRRVSQQRLVDVDEHAVRLPHSSGDCFPACIASLFEIPLDQAPGMGGNTQDLHDWLALNFPGISVVSRDWLEPKAPYFRPGYWIATVISSRFREPDCHHCTTDRRRKSKPPWFWRRAECPYCEGSGHCRGLHAIVMEHARRVWDPHPKADWDNEPRIVGETFFVVTDPARLTARTQPTPTRR